MIDLDLRHLDDSEPPVATEHRLGVSMVRGRAVRRRHNLVATMSATAAVVLVIALAGTIGAVRPRLLSTANPAGTSSGPPSVASVTPSSVPNEISASGIDPYYIGADARQLQEQGLLTRQPALSRCPAAYLPLKKYDAKTLKIAMAGDQITLVVGFGQSLRTPNGVTVGMTEDQLKRTIDAAQLVPVATKTFAQAYTIGKDTVMGFAFVDGRIRLLVAGTKALVTELLTSGALAAC